MISPVTSENMAKAEFNMQQLSPITLTKLSRNRCYGLWPLMTALHYKGNLQRISIGWVQTKSKVLVHVSVATKRRNDLK